MAKVCKRVKSDWLIGAHTVHSYKQRVTDPAVKRGRRSSKEIRRVIVQALNRVKQDGKTIYLNAESYQGNPKPKTLYHIDYFRLWTY